MTGGLKVVLCGEPVGFLQPLGDRGRLGFRFAGSYHDLADRPVLGQWFEDRLGRRRFLRPRGGEAMPRWFLNVLPEPGSPLRSLACRHAKLDEDDDPGLLAALGADLPGAAEVVPWSAPLPPGSQPLDPGTPCDADSPADPAPLGLTLSSLGGVQLKLSMSWRGERLRLAARAGDADWIVKFPAARWPGLVANEAAIMDWGRRAGFEVPEVRVVPAAVVETPEEVERPAGPLLAVRRFDRREHGRVHQEDFCQILDRRPDQKYDATYEALGRLARGLLGTSGAEEFLRRLVLVVASGNGDAHLKNHALVYPDGIRPAWSPLYDQVATVAWSSLAPEPAMEFWPGPRSLTAWTHLDRQAMLRLADRIGLDDDRAATAVDETLERLREARAALDALPDEHARRLEAHWARTPLLEPLRERPTSRPSR